MQALHNVHHNVMYEDDGYDNFTNYRHACIKTLLSMLQPTVFEDPYLWEVRKMVMQLVKSNRNAKLLQHRYLYIILYLLYLLT